MATKKKAKVPRKARGVDPRDFEVLFPHEHGHELRVLWSNGAGFSVYRIVEDERSDDEIKAAGALPHRLELLGEWEYVGGDAAVPLVRS